MVRLLRARLFDFTAIFWHGGDVTYDDTSHTFKVSMTCQTRTPCCKCRGHPQTIHKHKPRIRQ